MIELTDENVSEFAEAAGLTRGSLLPDGRCLGPDVGVAWPYDDTQPDVARWSPVQWVRSRFAPADRSILEFGCFEGLWTLRLAAMCREVTAVEVRPRNVCATLVRLFAHDVRNVRLVLQDVRAMDGTWSAGRPFDILFHYGVLYHLDQPVEHLFRIASLGPRLFLGTHVCHDDTPFERDDIQWAGRKWRAARYGEHGWSDPLSGVAPFSRWLFRDDLLEAVAAAGYTRVEAVREYTLPGNLPFIWIVAERS